MAYAPDPGQVFDTDAHRRVLAVVPTPDEDPISFNDIIGRLDLDPHVPVGTTQEDEVLAILDDLGSYVVKSDDGYVMSDEGFDEITDAHR